jgi:hypothetical protein
VPQADRFAAADGSAVGMKRTPDSRRNDGAESTRFIHCWNGRCESPIAPPQGS